MSGTTGCPKDVKEGLGLVQVYTGNGKGKTTCALGLAFRAVGCGLNVIMIQFLKPDGGYGEHISASRMEGVPPPRKMLTTKETSARSPWERIFRQRSFT